MKKLLTTALVALTLNTHAQDRLDLIKMNTWPVSSVNLRDTTDEDLQKLADAIGKSRIVMLGGMNGNDGETIRAKARIVRFLHQRLGFSVLAFQSDFYATNMIWDSYRRGDTTLAAIPSSLTQTLEFQEMQEYITANSRGANQLEITGFDSEATFTAAQGKLQKQMNTLFKDLGYNNSDPAYAQFVNTLVAANSLENMRQMDDTTFGYLKYFTKTILDDIKARPQADRTGFYAQTLRNYLGHAFYNWQNRKALEIDPTIHDRQMASNMVWIAEQKYASRKIIVWANNQNISKNNETIEILVNNAPRKTQPTTMGNEMSRVFEDEMFTIGFASMEGQTIVGSSDEALDIKSTGRNDYFTNVLGASGFKYAFTDFRSITRTGEVDDRFIMRAWNYETEMTGSWFNVYDGMFFIKTNKAKTPMSTFDYTTAVAEKAAPAEKPAEEKTIAVAGGGHK